MDWTTLLPPWGLAALALVSLAIVVAVIVALFRNKFRVEEIEIPLPFFKVKAARVEEDKKERGKKGKGPEEKSPSPRRSRTIQKAKAAGGAKAGIDQSAPKGAAATQEGTADGKDTELELKQTIH